VLRNLQRRLSFFENLALARFQRLSKFEVDDHTDVFLGTRHGEKYIVLKSHRLGDTNYVWWNETEARNLVSEMTELLDGKSGLPPGEGSTRTQGL
jgi:hypothetical protein